MGGRYYYRQIEDLAVNLCTAKTFTDEDWREYLRGSLAVARELGRGPSVSLITFTGDTLNAGQRRVTAKFMVEEHVRPIERVGILTDSQLLRGAMTAFAWLMPSMKYRAFRPGAATEALTWLAQAGKFDPSLALSAWAEAKATLRVDF